MVNTKTSRNIFYTSGIMYTYDSFRREHKKTMRYIIGNELFTILGVVLLFIILAKLAKIILKVLFLVAVIVFFLKVLSRLS